MLIAALALAACGRTPTQTATTQASVATSAQPAPVSTTAMAAGADAYPIVGSWSDDGNCAHIAMRISEDGSYVSGPNSGHWKIEGDQLVLTGRATVSATIHWVDRDHLDLSTQSGEEGVSVRCPAR